MGRTAAHRGPSEDGAIQIVEVRERVEEIALPPPPTEGRAPTAPIRPFSWLSDEELLSIGVPTDWLADVRTAGEDAFPELGPHLPAEAAESLLQFATTGVLNKPAPALADPYAHPDAQRRFRVIENVDELAQALDSPWEKWMVLLFLRRSWPAHLPATVLLEGARRRRPRARRHPESQLSNLASNPSAADRILPRPQRDVDGIVEERKGTVSVFNGPEPKIVVAQDEAGETSAVAAFIKDSLGDGIAPREIGVFTRAPESLGRARTAVQTAGAEALELSERGDDPGERVSIGTMHFAKGLEFKAVAVIACDEDALPLRSRIDLASDETELEDVYETERQLLYVAATRARDRLLVTGVKPGSEFLRDMGATLSARQN